MPTVYAVIVLVAAAGMMALAIVTLIVVAGIRREERESTMMRRKAPGVAAWLTRRIVGLYIRDRDQRRAPGSGPRPGQSARRYQDCR